jgi:hypothetical protein
MLKDKLVSEKEFDELCRYVCHQLVKSKSEESDRETLYFAIYWQMCEIFKVPLKIIPGLNSNLKVFQQNLADLVNERKSEDFDVLEVVEKNINQFLEKGFDDPKARFMP